MAAEHWLGFRSSGSEIALCNPRSQAEKLRYATLSLGAVLAAVVSFESLGDLTQNLVDTPHAILQPGYRLKDAFEQGAALVFFYDLLPQMKGELHKSAGSAVISKRSGNQAEFFGGRLIGIFGQSREAIVQHHKGGVLAGGRTIRGRLDLRSLVGSAAFSIKKPFGGAVFQKQGVFFRCLWT